MGAQCTTGCKTCCSDNSQIKDQFPLVEAKSAIEEEKSANNANADSEPGAEKAPLASVSDSDECTPMYYLSLDLADFQLIDENSKPGLRPPHVFRSGSTYHGEWQGRCRHGFGVQRWPGGVVYEGEWSNNMANACGKFSRSGRDLFIGKWKDSFPHGVGYYSKSGDSGVVFRGEWVQGVQSGFGYETWQDEGTNYAGDFRNGQKHGHGTYTWAEGRGGAVFRGRWALNHIEGVGEYTQGNGAHFLGKWHDSVIHGIGRYSWSDGRVYAGQYKSDRKEGFGSFQWADGRRYEGFWLGGKQHGHGKYTNEDGETRTAVFTHGNVTSMLDNPGK